MAESDTVTGQRVVEILHHAQEHRALLTVRVAGHAFEGLTMITDISKLRLRWVMRIDPPKGFERFTENLTSRTLRFGFRGPDLVEYAFTVSGGVADGPTLRFPLPEELERQQRRSNFRMETPPGTLLQFTYQSQQLSLELINISLSGTLGVLARPRKIDGNTPWLKVGDALTGLRILLPAGADSNPPQVVVKRATVRRAEHDAEHAILRYALEFLHLSPTDERVLVHFVYQLQRRYLQRK
ncbi:MAG: PilZ domain-containing protein [Desulfobacterales bacterium]|jgi:hypothetical protein